MKPKLDKASRSSTVSKELSASAASQLISKLETRFEKNMHRHKGLAWKKVLQRLETNAAKLWTLNEMELSGGEPDVVDFDKKTGQYVFFDCAPQTPTGRRSLCYDRDAWEERKEHKPKNSAMEMALEMGVDILSEEQYRYLQTLDIFDTTTSSWLQTPGPIRKLGGAIFADRRYDTVFIYHNGAPSYYAARGFRGAVMV